MEPQETDQLLGAGDTPAGPEDALAHLKGFKLKNTIEIPLFMILFGLYLSGAPISNLNMYRTCVHSLNYTVADCKSFLDPEKINHTQELEKEVQEYVTLVNTVNSVLEAIVPAVLSLFLGVWSDKHGRKPLIAWTLFGLTFSAILTVVYGLMEELGPWWYIISCLPFSLTGGYKVLMIGAICFISDVTSNENRSFRLMIIQLTFALGHTAGAMLSPYTVKGIGNLYLLLLVASLYTFAYAFTMIFIEESLVNISQVGVILANHICHYKLNHIVIKLHGVN
ncbi:proton-coupled folate transporter-like [Ostrinia furnacalis]|uniref:proton-coupled folate transporter-like n=1 Tax=Ostrinia furnacalis TaxID=93504 RepID=UPI0010407CEB|nr:proton-coupled folate transporter-like [Ostrinia furnacalis]XP_028174954.1 proton-coupled folate transporter-like [Ostrinia furnacalis]XP_028174955.1 proton-coupled folate transporter-like [Ostrinia furnacalis]